MLPDWPRRGRLTANRVRLCVLVASAVPIVALGQDAGVHPDRLNLTVAGAVSDVRRRDTASALRGLTETASRLRRAVRVDSIGTLDGPERTVLGLIADVAVDRARRVYVLDMAFEVVRVFSDSGVPLFEFGRSGNGPLEFRTPVALWIHASDQTVFVVDAGHGIKQFRLDAAGRPTLLRQTPLKGSARDACTFGEGVASLVATANRADSSSDANNMVYVTMSGGGERSFGSGYRSPNWLTRYVMGEGVIGCGRNQVVAALSALPFIRAFRGDGTPIWTARLADFTPPRMVESKTARGQSALGLDPEVPPHNSVRNIVSLGQDFFVVQAVLITRQALLSRSLYSEVETYLIDARSGQGVYVGRNLPLLNAIVGDFAYASATAPFPRVIRFRLP